MKIIPIALFRLALGAAKKPIQSIRQNSEKEPKRPSFNRTVKINAPSVADRKLWINLAIPGKGPR